MTNFLKKIREEKRISQSNLARKIGVSKQLLCGFENGRSGISNEVLAKLALALEVPKDAIITGKYDKSYDLKGKQQLAEALKLTFDFYGDEFDKDTIIKISTELYGLIVDFDGIKDEANKINFKKSLEDKIALGLASKCFLQTKI